MTERALKKNLAGALGALVAAEIDLQSELGCSSTRKPAAERERLHAELGCRAAVVTAYATALLAQGRGR